MIEEKAIKEVIDSHSFVELKGDIKEDNSYKTFLIDVQTEGGQSPLQWEVRIAPFYPFNPTLPFAPRFLRCISNLTMAVCVTVYYRFCLS